MEHQILAAVDIYNNPREPIQESRRLVVFVQRLSVVLLASLFCFSSVDKLFHYSGFLNALRDYSLIPQGFAKYLAMPVIITEAVISSGLMFKQSRRTSAFIGSCILVLFSVALFVNYLYGKRGICGCWFTITLAQGTGMHLLQNLFLIGLLVSIWWNERSNKVSSLAAPSVRL